MKKFKYFLFALVAFCCVSCYDDSGEFVEQMQTNDDITLGLRACLKTALDTANSHLCVDNGFSAYDNGKYAIGLPTSAAAIRDTLAAHGESALIDTLLAKTNRAAESVGSVMKTNFSATITTMNFSNPSQVLKGADDAATTALQLNYSAALKSAVAQGIASQLIAKGAFTTWSQVLTAYAKYNSTPVSVDFQQHVINQIFDAFFAEMKVEEANIRHNPDHRISDILKTTFSVLD
ncbi:MAG: DUF4197 domain-containing protein [Bacteroidales bacterium]|nr:DUF4197 domain-containing protein [Bacteroidales bacterium]